MPVHGDAILVGRRSLIAAAAGAACLFGSGCAWGAASSDEGEEPEPSIEVCLAAPSCLDPGAAPDQASLQIVWQLFEPLLAYDFASGALAGRAAASLDVADDARTFTFHLREATFHNGEPVTAAAFKRAWERIVDPMSALAARYGDSPHAWRLALVEGYAELRRGSARDLAGLSCLDDRTLEVRLSAPYADFPFIVAHPSFAPVPAAAEDDVAAFAQAPVGNGPFAMDGSFEPGAPAVRLKGFEGYRGGAPEAQGVRFVIEDDVVAGYREFLTGGSDVCACPVDEVQGAASRYGSAEDGMTLGADGRLAQTALPCCSCLVMNTAAAPLDDAAVRRALSLAIDREDLCSVVFRGLAAPADDVVPPAVHGRGESPWPYADFDLSRAQELLDGGHPRGEDGTRELDLTIIYHADGGHQKVMERVAQHLEAAGVPCELEALELDELYARLEAGDFQLARLDAQTDSLTLDSILYPWFHASSLDARNYARFSDEDVDRLIDEARATADIDERMELLREADALIGEEAPVIPLVYPARATVASDKIEELEVDPLGFAHLGDARLATRGG